MFVVAARSLGMPARFVSGYCAWSTASIARRRMAGRRRSSTGSAGSGSIRAPGVSPEERYVRVAVALDAAGAAPVAGSRLGEGEEELDVDVTVAPSGG